MTETMFKWVTLLHLLLSISPKLANILKVFLIDNVDILIEHTNQVCFSFRSLYPHCTNITIFLITDFLDLKIAMSLELNEFFKINLMRMVY